MLSTLSFLKDDLNSRIKAVEICEGSILKRKESVSSVNESRVYIEIKYNFLS